MAESLARTKWMCKYHTVFMSKYHDDAAPYQMVFGLAVEPSVQHKGIAALLMKKFIEQAKESHKAIITLTCKKKLIPFYEQFGYLDEGKSVSSHGGACRNALRANVIAEERLPSFISIVPAGVTRLAILQRQGYSYIKP